MPPEISPEILAEFEELAIYLFIVNIIVWLLFAWTIQKTLLLIKTENQVILPNQAWLLVVPFFNIYWNFEVARRLSYSLNNEFFDRKVAVEEMPTYKYGMVYAWSFLLFNFPLMPLFVRVLAMVVCLMYFIAYWVKIHQYRTLIKDHDHWLASKTENNED